MRYRTGDLCSVGFKYGMLLGVLYCGAAQAESTKPSAIRANTSALEIVTPMTDRGPSMAPYSVKFRITGFLARQHARDGNTWRSLVEFYSMLNVDDPAWTDNDQ